MTRPFNGFVSDRFSMARGFTLAKALSTHAVARASSLWGDAFLIAGSKHGDLDATVSLRLAQDRVAPQALVGESRGAAALKSASLRGRSRQRLRQAARGRYGIDARQSARDRRWAGGCSASVSMT